MIKWRHYQLKGLHEKDITATRRFGGVINIIIVYFAVMAGDGTVPNATILEQTFTKKKKFFCKNVSFFSNKDCVGCRKFCTYILGVFIGHLQFGIIMIHPVVLQSSWYTFITQFFSWVSLMPRLYRYNRKYIVLRRVTFRYNEFTKKIDPGSIDYSDNMIVGNERPIKYYISNAE